MNSVEIEKKIRELVGHYLIKDYHVTVRRGDVILLLPLFGYIMLIRMLSSNAPYTSSINLLNGLSLHIPEQRQESQ